MGTYIPEVHKLKAAEAAFQAKPFRVLLKAFFHYPSFL